MTPRIANTAARLIRGMETARSRQDLVADADDLIAALGGSIHTADVLASNSPRELVLYVTALVIRAVQ